MFGWKPSMNNVCKYLLVNDEFLVMVFSDKLPNASPTSRVTYLANIKKYFENEGLLTKEISFQLDLNKDRRKIEELLGALFALETLGIVEQSPYIHKGQYWWLRRFKVIDKKKLQEVSLKLN